MLCGRYLPLAVLSGAAVDVAIAANSVGPSLYEVRQVSKVVADAVPPLAVIGPHSRLASSMLTTPESRAPVRSYEAAVVVVGGCRRQRLGSR